MDSFDMVMESIDTSSPAEEGLNWDTSTLIHDPKVKQMRKYLKVGRKAYKLKLYDEALKYFKASEKLCDEMKKLVDKAREPDTFMERLLSYFTPIISLLPAYSVDEFGYLVIYNDDMSLTSTSVVKKNIQYRLNAFKLLIKKSEKVVETNKPNWSAKVKNSAALKAKLEKNAIKLEAYKNKLGVK